MDSLGEPLWIGPYRLTSRIATGGMAEVYVGRHISPEGNFGPMVAVKKLLPHLVKDSAIVRMFLNEARITAQIQHPNVVQIFELGQVDGEPFIAMELLEGRTWAELRQRAAENAQRMPANVALRVLCEACRGLDAAHRAVDEENNPLSLVHRDFTPDNIHVGVNGDVKVIDFGIARTNAWGSGTEPGTLKGKFFYMSPEMITAKPVDHRADIFAAGVMLYEQLCGRRPFTGTSVDEVVIRIAREEAAPPSTWDPAVPKALEAICMRALAKDPQQRFQSLAELVIAIQGVGGPGTSAQTAEYVSTLFPEKTDERRKTLRRAREADPSVPGTPHRGLELTTQAGVPAQQVKVEEPTPIVPLAPAAAPKRSKLPLIIGAIVLLGLAGAALIAFSQPTRTSTEQLALAETEQGEVRVKSLLKLAALPDASADQLSRAAALLVQDKAWDAVLSLTDVWLQRDATSLDARLYEAQAATRVRKGKRAENAIAEAEKRAPDDARPAVLLAQLKEMQGEQQASLDAWSRAVAREPNNPSYLARQGYWLSQIDKLDDAEAALTKSLKRRNDPATRAELGFVKFRKGQKDDALKLLRAVVKDAPDLEEGHYYLASVLFQNNDIAGARAEYLAADTRAGDDTRPLVALCQMEQLQQTAELEAAKQKLRERFPKDADALIGRCSAATP